MINIYYTISHWCLAGGGGVGGGEFTNRPTSLQSPTLMAASYSAYTITLTGAVSAASNLSSSLTSPKYNNTIYTSFLGTALDVAV